MDRRFHQSIKKHLPHTQHDLYLVNRIVSLYPYIIIALIPLAICLMLFLRLTSGSTEIEGGISPILARIHSLISGNVVGQCQDSGHCFLIGCCNPVFIPFIPIYLLLWHSVEWPPCEQRIIAYRRRSQPFWLVAPSKGEMMDFDLWSVKSLNSYANSSWTLKQMQMQKMALKGHGPVELKMEL